MLSNGNGKILNIVTVKKKLNSKNNILQIRPVVLQTSDYKWIFLAFVIDAKVCDYFMPKL